MRICVLLSLVLVGACGPSVGGPDNGNGGNGNKVDAGTGGNYGPEGAVAGVVWAPGNAPGQVPAGHEIPIAGALVYVSRFAPPEIPQTVYCDRCDDTPGTGVLTDAHGQFTIPNIQPDEYWLVIQKGQFRLDQKISIFASQTIQLPAANTTLPSRHDPAHGYWVPRIAIAYGFYDELQDIFGKMGIGAVSDYGEYVAASAAGNIDFWDNDAGSSDLDNVSKGSIDELVSDINNLRQYHIIFVPCTDTYATALFSNAQYRANIKQYVSEGGKFYVTDWAAEWEDAVFPEFIQFAASHDTPANAQPSQFSNGDGGPGYNSNGARAVDPGLHEWLASQSGPLDEFATNFGAFNADDFGVFENWDHIVNLASIQIGTDNDNLPINEQAYTWVEGDWDGDGAMHPLTVTFEPEGCGRVLYSTYHTTDVPHAGLIPQERVLLYLIMEIGLCKSGPIVQ